MIITTNLEFSKWNGIFFNEVITSAIVDRLIHHCHLLVFTGKSYRLEHSSLNYEPIKGCWIINLPNAGYLSYQIHYFFQPVTKLVSKERVKSKVKKQYDEPKTLLMRVLDSPSVDDSMKQSLQDQYEKLNPAELKRQIVKIQNQLIEMVSLKNDSVPHSKEVNVV